MPPATKQVASGNFLDPDLMPRSGLLHAWPDHEDALRQEFARVYSCRQFVNPRPPTSDLWKARGMGATRLEHVRANVADLNAAVEWYTTVLGFEVEAYWPPEAPNYAHFTTGSGATFAVMEAEGRGGRFNFTVDDPDAVWSKVRDLAVVVEPLFDTPYGTRKFTIADPDGNELGFVRNS